MKKFLYIAVLVLGLSGCAGRGWIWNGWSSSNAITVQRGDTLYSISRRYGVPLKDLINANNLHAPYTLHVGQVLSLPAKQYHTVQRGDTLYSISRQYNVDITSLSRVNNLQTPYSLNVGDRLVLPASVGNVPAASYSTAQSSASSASSAAVKTAYTPAKSAPVTDSYVAPKARKTKFDWPVKGTIISGYGNLGSGRKNDGINIKAALGTNVKAADSGTIAYAGNELKGFGNLILIKHSDGWITAYAHNDRLFVKKGQKVSRGEKIATVGSTGSVTTPQLHFEVRSGKKAVNPRPYLP
ncbi:MAG: LysM peptidoglycan-binding domain-containing protein [Alphaproteobacteria bacterium]|nr:LysM peptidoglycan-binding domain-containing protein [Alphaproteobacteria bacterium]MDY4690128.1 LysM peptidoglycan-binding domain-containing protein [Alphaproteobacteria bacterium]